MNYSPIILFVYNRPAHAFRTIEALKANTLASNSELFIYCDNYKTNASENEKVKVGEVRDIVRKTEGFKRVEIIERDKNWGLADSIVDGITSVLKSYEKVIVLEDDILSSPGFLQYMNDALDLYKDDESVMHVSGYMYPTKKELPPTFFYKPTSCWGWGTWKESWTHFNGDAKALLKQFSSKSEIDHFNLKYGDFYEQLKMNDSGQLKSWAVKWYASVFFKNGYSLHPGKSLTKNIGHDGSGENCDDNLSYQVDDLQVHLKPTRIKIEESKTARKEMEKFYLEVLGIHSGNRLSRVLKKLTLKLKY